MKKILVVLAMAAATACIEAALETVELTGADASAPAGRVVAVSAVSTNQTGTLVVSRVTPLRHDWIEESVVAVTNWTYSVETATTNLVETSVTNVVNAATGVTNVVTNVTVTAISFPVTNSAATVEYARLRTPRTLRMAVTNQMISLTLSGGVASTNCNGGSLILPHDYVVTSGSALPGGRAYIVIER